MFITITTPNPDKTKAPDIKTIEIALHPAEALFMTASQLTAHINESLGTPLSTTIDGTGIQLNYMVNGLAYLIAGSRQGGLMSVNGGKISKESRIIDQLADELEEETFGALKFVRSRSSDVDPWEYQHSETSQLLIESSITGECFSLKCSPDLHHSIENHPKFCYFATQAQIDPASMDSLQRIAMRMTPTARVWNCIGNEFFKLRPAADFKGPWEEHWNSKEIREKREAAKVVVQKTYESVPRHQLLIDPCDVFANLNTLFDDVSDAEAYKIRMNEQIGKYSERPFYAVFPKYALMDAINFKTEIRDVTSDYACTSIFDSRAVAATSKVIEKYAPSPIKLSLLNRGPRSIVIFDNDGTLLNSQVAEAQRILSYLRDIVGDGFELPPLDALLKIGYGQKVWAEGLCAELVKLCPAFTDTMMDALKHKIQSASIEDPHVLAMAKQMELCPGVKECLHVLIKQNSFIGIATDNYAILVKNALNHHLRDVIECIGPDEHPPETPHLFLNNQHGLVFPDKCRKPDPRKLLLQQLTVYLSKDLIAKEDAARFISDVEFRTLIQDNARKRGYFTTYIGDAKEDLIAADNAGFDTFVAVTKTGKHHYREFVPVAEELAAKGSRLKIVMVDDLLQIHGAFTKLELDGYLRLSLVAGGGVVAVEATTSGRDLTHEMVV